MSPAMLACMTFVVSALCLIVGTLIHSPRTPHNPGSGNGWLGFGALFLFISFLLLVTQFAIDK